MQQPTVLSLQNGIVLGANSAWRSLTGVVCDAQFPEGVGLSDLAAQHVDDQSAANLDVALQHLTASSLDVPRIEVRFLRNSIPQTWQVTITPLLAPDAELFAAIWTFEDTSTESSTQTDHQHKDTAEAVTQLSTDIAHEFNNLLTAVIGNLEIIRNQADKTTHHNLDSDEWPASCDANLNQTREQSETAGNRPPTTQHPSTQCRPDAVSGNTFLPTRIGLVDNENGVRSIGREMLELQGHTVSVYASGQELLDAIADGIQLDMILLDRTMPAMSGPETYRRLRSTGCCTPVIVCSGSSVNLKTFGSDINDAPNGFLAKPFTLATLRDMVTRTCSGHS